MKSNNGYYYSAPFNNSLLGSHNRKIISKLSNQVGEDTVIVDELWVTRDPSFISTIKDDIKTLIIYSGIDASQISFTHQHLYEPICKFDHFNIGNFYGNYYFSFWLDIIYENLHFFAEEYSPLFTYPPIKPYMCLNRKPHKHRQELVYSLINRGLDKKGIVSLGKIDNEDFIIEDLKPILLEDDIVDFIGDKCTKEKYGITNNIFNLGHINNWGGHFLNVVTETEIFSPGFITEKTLKPIVGHRPFIILGDLFTYRILHDWGIDTFDDLFGTGYNLPKYKDRIKWIVSTLEDVSREKNLDGLLLELRPRLIYNYNTLLEAAIKNRKKIDTLLL